MIFPSFGQLTLYPPQFFSFLLGANVSTFFSMQFCMHFRDFASPTMAHPRCRELCKRAGSLRLAELFRPILFLLLPGSYFFLKVD